MFLVTKNIGQNWIKRVGQYLIFLHSTVLITQFLSYSGCFNSYCFPTCFQDFNWSLKPKVVHTLFCLVLLYSLDISAQLILKNSALHRLYRFCILVIPLLCSFIFSCMTTRSRSLDLDHFDLEIRKKKFESFKEVEGSINDWTSSWRQGGKGLCNALDRQSHHEHSKANCPSYPFWN